MRITKQGLILKFFFNCNWQEDSLGVIKKKTIWSWRGNKKQDLSWLFLGSFMQDYGYSKLGLHIIYLNIQNSSNWTQTYLKFQNWVKKILNENHLCNWCIKHFQNHKEFVWVFPIVFKLKKLKFSHNLGKLDQ